MKSSKEKKKVLFINCGGGKWMEKRRFQVFVDDHGFRSEADKGLGVSGTG
jgi:hypothetical protein